MHYRDEGRNHEQTLVLLHGYLQNLDIWSSYVLSYMRTMHVITIDLPGHGYSECFGDVHSMDLMAKAVKAVLDGWSSALWWDTLWVDMSRWHLPICSHTICVGWDCCIRMHWPIPIRLLSDAWRHATR